MTKAIDNVNCGFCGGHRTAEIRRFKGHENGDIYQYCDACGANTRFHPRKSGQKELREKYAPKPVNENQDDKPVNEPPNKPPAKASNTEEPDKDVNPEPKQEKPAKSFFDF